MSPVKEAGVRARGLVKRYGELIAVDGVDLSVPYGACLGLLGPNGAGKTTTIEILEGLGKPDAGEVEVLGLDWKRHAGEIRSFLQDEESRRSAGSAGRDYVRERHSLPRVIDRYETALEQLLPRREKD